MPETAWGWGGLNVFKAAGDIFRKDFMRQTRKQRLITMRKTIGYHPHHPRQMRWEHFNILNEKTDGKWTVKKQGRRAATSEELRLYQSMKKAGV